MQEEILRIKNLSKSFKKNQVLNYVNFYLYQGEVIGIMGLHNSGKTVLCNILSGNEPYCKGSIYFEEELCDITAIQQDNKICMIHKTSSLIDSLSIMENIFVIRKSKKNKLLVHRRFIRKEMDHWLKEFNIHISPTEKAGRLTKVQRYIIEILKAYIFGAKIIVIDDILFENKPNEYYELNQIIELLKTKGISFIITSYQIKFLQLYSERIYFLSNGSMVKCINNTKRKQIDIEKILINQDYKDLNTRDRLRNSDEIILSLQNISNQYLKDISFNIKKGEILVVFDLLKDSNEELWKLLINQSPYEGNIFYQDNNIEFVKHDYQKDVIFADFDMNNKIYEYLSVSDNICISNYKRLSTFGYVKKRRIRFVEKEFSQWYGDSELIEREYCTNLSEKQKISIYMYRLRLQSGNILFCKNPEQIADYITFQLIEQELRYMADNGMAVCILTSNIEHISLFADRFVILSEGKIDGNFTPSNLWERDLE